MISPQNKGFTPSLLPLRFFGTAILSALVGSLILMARPEVLSAYHYNQFVVATTHLFVLGWILSVIMGAMYQLAPVAFERKLHSEKLARRQWYWHVIGVAGMVYFFWKWDMKQVGHFGSIFAIGGFIFVYNLARTLPPIKKWNAISFGMASALGWLSITMLAGLYVACSKCWNFSPFAPLAAMHAHAHLGILGCIIMLIIAASYKLVPMFMVSRLKSEKRAWASLILLNVALLGLIPSITLESKIKTVFAALGALSVALYGLEMRAIIQLRFRKKIEFSLRIFLIGIGLLAPVSSLGLFLSWPGLPVTALTTQLENLYGFLALFGVITFCLLGMLYKIVPFLVWFKTYSEKIGLSRVPALNEMFSEKLQAIAFGFFTTALILTSVAIVESSSSGVRAGGAFFLIAWVLTTVNFIKVAAHLYVPVAKPLNQSTAPSMVASASKIHASTI